MGKKKKKHKSKLFLTYTRFDDNTYCWRVIDVIDGSNISGVVKKMITSFRLKIDPQGWNAKR